MECVDEDESARQDNESPDVSNGQNTNKEEECQDMKRKSEHLILTSHDAKKAKMSCDNDKTEDSVADNQSHSTKNSDVPLEEKRETNPKDSVNSNEPEPSEHNIVDLSKKNFPLNTNLECKQPLPTADDDIIIIKDEEVTIDPASDSNHELLRKLSVMHKNQASRILQLQDSVRREEAKLILLKKLRQSQLTKHHQPVSSQNEQVGIQPVPSSTASNSRSSSMHATGAYSKQSTQSTHASRSNQNFRLPNQSSSSSSSSSSTNSAQLQANRNALAAMMQMPQLMQAGSLLRGANPLLMGQNDLASNMQQFLLQQQKSLQQQQKSRNVAPAASFKQQQAAAKLSLRKQLEKTLLEIPPPKPPPPEITFLPSAASNEFICLVGLEQVVGKIQHFQTKSSQKLDKLDHSTTPSVCLQCKKDFSPLWKSVKSAQDEVICLQCVNTNQKKALKAEHTNRLKTAFVKALQQEQEIEHRMQEQQAQLHSQQANQAAVQNQVTNQTLTAAVVAAATQLQQQQAQLKKLQEEQLRRHQKMLQRAQQQYQQQRSVSSSSSGGFRPHNQSRSSSTALPFPFNTSSLKPEERQLLLDMMPQRSRSGNSSVSQTDKWKQSWNWK